MKVDIAPEFWGSLRNLFGPWSRVREGWYWLKCAVWYRHNRLHIKTLPVTWSDRCTRLPHAMFQILVDFIDSECSPGIVNWDGSPEHRKVRDEMQDHYDWWKNTGLTFDEFDGLDDRDLRPLGEWFSPPDERGVCTMLETTEAEKSYFKAAQDREDNFNGELNRRLKRLVDLMPYMWT